MVSSWYLQFKNKIISKFVFESQKIHKTFYLSQILERVPDSFYPSARYPTRTRKMYMSSIDDTLSTGKGPA